MPLTGAKSSKPELIPPPKVAALHAVFRLSRASKLGRASDEERDAVRERREPGKRRRRRASYRSAGEILVRALLPFVALLTVPCSCRRISLPAAVPAIPAGTLFAWVLEPAPLAATTGAVVSGFGSSPRPAAAGGARPRHLREPPLHLSRPVKGRPPAYDRFSDHPGDDGAPLV